MTLDVVIVGGGLIGGLAAWRLSQSGARVALVERTAIGAGASTAAGGILGAQIEMHGGAISELAFASIALYPGLIDELRDHTGIAVPLTWPGTLYACVADDDETATSEALRIRDAHEWQRRSGHAVELLDARALEGREPSLGRSCRAAVLFPEDGLVDPAVLVGATARALEVDRVEMHVGRGVVRVVTESGRARGVALDDGTRIDASTVVVCAGAWTSLVDGIPREVRRIRPIRGQMLEVAAEPGMLRSIVFGNGIYVVPHAGGRLVIGSTLEDVGFRSEPTVEGIHGLVGAARRVVPGLATAAWRRTWAGLRPTSEDHLPVIGPTPIDGLFVASGHFRNGILLAPITASVVSAMVRGAATPVAIGAFAPVREAA